MPKFRYPSADQLRSRARAIATSRRTRRWVVGLLVAIGVYGLLGFFALPPLIRHLATPRLSAMLSRPVTIDSIKLNPYTLRIEIDGLHIGGHSEDGKPAPPFVDVGRIMVDAAWSSLFRLKPVIQQVDVDAPRIHIVRTAPQQFNFTDLVRQFSKPSDKPSSGKPLLFSVSNIRLDQGRIDFDDQVTGQQHTIDDLQIGIPFIANLPSKVKVFVQPLLSARVDGSPLHVTGHLRPFDESRDANVAIRLHNLDLPKLSAYAPASLPVVLSDGQLSTDLDLRFALNAGAPHIDVSGSIDLQRLTITARRADAKAPPLFAATLIHLDADHVEPLQQIVHLADLRVVQPSVNLSRDADGALDITKLLTAKPAATPSAPDPSVPASASTATTQPAASSAPAAQKSSLDLQLAQLQLEGGSVHFSDHDTATPTTLSLSGITLNARQLSTLLDTPATFTLQAKLDQGGALNGDGSLVLHKKTFDGTVAVDHLALPTFQPYLAALLNGQVAAGAVDTKLALKADWSGKTPEVQLGASNLTLNGLQLVKHGDRKAAISLQALAVKIKQVDLAKRTAEVSAVHVDGLSVTANRLHDGRIDLTDLLRHPPSSKVRAPAAAPKTSETPAWHYRVDDISVADSRLAFTDHSNDQPVSFDVSALKLDVHNVSQDLGKPLPVTLSAKLQREGRLQVSGTVSPTPLAAKLKLTLVGLDVAALEPYFASKLNAKLASAWFGGRGTLTLHQRDQAMDVGYDGSAGLWRVKMMDKATGDRFAGWHGLRLSPIHARYSPGKVDVNLGTVSLQDFYGRIFLDSSGKLNLSRFMTHNTPAGKESLTRADEAAPETPAVATAPSTTAAPAMAMKLHVDKTVLSGGEVDYSDEFVKPHFSAELSDIEGSVGAIGTDTTDPAPLQLTAKLNDNGSVKIDGTANPLAKPAFLDATAAAHDVELTHFSAYSTKYAGYPIDKGKLNVDLHYKLDHQQLTADNHIFISQLTFGDHVDNTTATHLPVLMAVALLKNPQGEIDVDVPVSGSLSDPQFSIGSVIWGAFANLIEKAVTSPFSLLAGAFGGSSHHHLNYVEFSPGSATLDDKALHKLAIIGKALAHRPQLKIVLIGRVDAATDTPALKQATLDHEVRLAKLADMGSKVKGTDADSLKLTPDEYDEYLAKVYSDADIKKPRTLLGFAKREPPAKMKQMLLDAQTVTPADLQTLAKQRADVVRQQLVAKIGADRVSLAQPGSDDAKRAAQRAEKTGQPPPTRVDFTLAR